MFVWPILILSYASNVTNIFCWKHIYRPMNYLCLKHISRNAKKSVSALYSLLYFNQSKWPILNVRLCGIFFVRFQLEAHFRRSSACPCPVLIWICLAQKKSI